MWLEYRVLVLAIHVLHLLLGAQLELLLERVLHLDQLLQDTTLHIELLDLPITLHLGQPEPQLVQSDLLYTGPQLEQLPPQLELVQPEDIAQLEHLQLEAQLDQVLL